MVIIEIMASPVNYSLWGGGGGVCGAYNSTPRWYNKYNFAMNNKCIFSKYVYLLLN